MIQTSRLRPRRRGLFAAAALVLLMAAGPALAAVEEEEPTDDAYGITGNWGGLRDRLKAEGWTFQIREKFEAGDLLSGGRELATGAGETRLGAVADLGKLFGLQGGKVQISFTDRYGSSLGPSTGVDPLMPFIEVHGRGDIWRLTQFSYAQDLPGGFNLKLGRVNPGTDFDAFSCNFENLTFCGSVPGNLVGDYWFNYPVSQWGARLKWTGQQVYAEAGVYQVNPDNLAKGFDLRFQGGKGVLAPVEVGWKPKLGPAGLPGTYILGAWYSDVKAPDLLLASNGVPQPLTTAPPLERRGRYGGYFSAEQQLTGQDKGKGLTVFVNYTQADRRTSRVDRQAAVGVSYQGLIPGRDKDQIALAFGQTHISDRAAQAAALANPGAPVAHNEYATELDYRLMAFGGLTLTPNLQYVSDPGGRPGRHATVLGVKTILKF
ncbi:MAG: carbohydrate porin [Caulobacterales bacterium]|jgi:porin